MSIVSVTLAPMPCTPSTNWAPSNPPPVDTSDNYFVFAPLIDAKLVANNTILVRVSLLVDAFVPSSSVQYETASASISGGILSCSFQFTPEVGKQPSGNVNLYYAEFTFAQLQETGPINQVQVFLRDTDPETSRGTVTTVQS